MNSQIRNLRELVFMKKQLWSDRRPVLLRWKCGVFVPEPREGSLEKAAERRAEQLFPTLLNRFNGQRRNVSEKVGPSYAPALFAKEPEAKANKVRKDTLTSATRLQYRQAPHGALHLGLL